MKLQVRHKTMYHYTRPASLAINQVCLLPRDTPTQRCLSTHLSVQPEPSQISYDQDHYGNRVARYAVEHPHEDSSVTVTSVLENDGSPAVLPASLDVITNRKRLKSQTSTEDLMAHDCLLASQFVPMNGAVDTLCKQLHHDGATVLERADNLMRFIFENFQYDSEFSTLVTPIADVIEARRGVCQDFAHLAIAALRQWGIPARYVSGYLETLPPPGKTKLQGADASHAWFSVFDCETGWYDFDPTNGKRPDTQYVTTAWGRDYADVTPIKGVVSGGGKHTLTVEVDVNRLGVIDAV